MNYTIKEIQKALMSGEITSVELVKKSIETFESDKKSSQPLNAFLEIYADAVSKAEEADKLIQDAKSKGAAEVEKLFAEKPLLGMPFANKDNISAKGKKLTCASKILEGYVAPYNATVINRLENAGAIPLGRCNQDEFAMGSSTEYSVYGATRNPINKDYVSGGSSGGSAAAVSSNQALFGIGTETGGSVRLPASYCGIYGLKPTYGVLSRWGVVAYGSSLDQVGLLGHTPADIAEPLSLMCGVDTFDDTSADLPNVDSIKNLSALSDDEFKSLKIAIPAQFLKTDGADADVVKCFEETRAWFENKGAKIEVVDLPILDASIASYYVIALSEAASNLSRFDGIRYGFRAENVENLLDLYKETRAQGFGDEVKRRIMLGTYSLSAGTYDAYYKKAQQVRTLIKQDFDKVLADYDVIVGPTAPTPAFKIGENVEDPLTMYANDILTIPINLAGLPAISIPCGFEDGMPLGLQIIGNYFDESTIYRVAHVYEQSTDFHKQTPQIWEGK